MYTDGQTNKESNVRFHFYKNIELSNSLCRQMFLWNYHSLPYKYHIFVFRSQITEL